MKGYLNFNNTYYFSLGRNAIYKICKLINLNNGDEVLTPAWDCFETLEPFRVVKAKCIFYKIDPSNLNVDIENMKALISTRTKLIHIINYFGFPQPWDEILRLRGELDIPILEDNAYSLFSSFNKQEFGSFGDYAIFSIRKILPIPSGGMLRINTNNLYEQNIKAQRLIYPAEYKFVMNKFIHFIKNTLGLKNVSIFGFLRKERKVSKYLPPIYSDSLNVMPEWDRSSISKDFAYDYERPISKFSKFILNLYSAKKINIIKKKKREYYINIVNELADLKNIKILNSFIQEEVVPECISILVESNRDKILSYLQNKRYPIMAWPTLSDEVIKNLKQYPDVETLGKRIIQVNLDINNSSSVYKHLVFDLRSIVNSI